MAVDSHALIERGWGPETPANYTKKDVILYALGVGASELRYVYENNDEFACLPSMPFGERWFLFLGTWSPLSSHFQGR